MMAAQPTAMNPPATLALVDDDPAVRDLWARQFARRRTFLVTGVFADAESALPRNSPARPSSPPPPAPAPAKRTSNSRPRT